MKIEVELKLLSVLIWGSEGRIIHYTVIYPCAEDYDWKLRWKMHGYASKLKHVFGLEENVSRPMGQNSWTP